MENNINYEMMCLAQEQRQTINKLKKAQNQYAQMLKEGEMGKDLKAVLSGQVTVKISLKERIKFKIKCFFDKLFKAL